MELFKNTTDLIGLKDNNITISFVLKHQTHIEIRAKLDYQAPACSFCRGNMIKYDFQKSSTIPILDVQGMPTLLKLKKRRFQCKNCRKVVISQTSLVRKNHQISQPVWAKITQLLTESLSNAAIARQCHVSVATVQRQLENFQIKETFNKLPAILSWDEFSRNKGQLAFIAQDFETRQIVTVLEDNKQTTIKNFFYKFPRKGRETVKVVTV
ncbi:transposase family protein, partial [Streptococcus pluranimalium]